MSLATHRRPGDGSLIWEWNETAMDVLTPSRPPVADAAVRRRRHARRHVRRRDGDRALRRAVRHGDLGTARRVGRGRRGHRRPPRARRLPAGERRRVRRGARRSRWRRSPTVRPRPTASPWARRPAGARSPTPDDGTQSGPLPAMLPPGPACGRRRRRDGRAGAVAGDRSAVHDALAGPVPPGAAAGARLAAATAAPSTRSAASAAPTRRERTAEQTEIARFWADQPIAQGQRDAAQAKAEQLGWDLAADGPSCSPPR